MSVQLEPLMAAFLQTGASDLHLFEDGIPTVRIHGDLHVLPAFPDPIAKASLWQFSEELVGAALLKKFQEEHELDCAKTMLGTRLRINFYYEQGKLAWAIRALPLSFFALDKLGLPENVCNHICGLQRGLVLVTGATGSGKSTTLASIINRINEERPCHIFTIEDPIEYVHSNKKAFVSQREVGDDTGSFHEALRRVLREDPDVVLIGEMRDTITMRSALTLAETGHLTFATLHTCDAVQTISRIISSFPAEEQDVIRTQLATTLRVVLSQQLIPWSNGKGRSMAAEILMVTPAVQAQIRENKIHQISSSMQTGQSLGMRMMNASLKALFNAGKIDSHTALTYSPNKEELARDLNILNYMPL